MEIKVSIDKDTGKITIEGEGYRGPKCLQDIDKLTKLLGAAIISDRAKNEFVQREVSHQTTKR